MGSDSICSFNYEGELPIMQIEACQSGRMIESPFRQKLNAEAQADGTQLACEKPEIRGRRGCHEVCPKIPQSDDGGVRK